MSHHYSGPEFGFPHGDARLDLTDLYAFPKPGDASKSIFIMNVHPSVGVSPPGPTTEVPFATEAIYELKIDADGDSVADIAYRVCFTTDKSGAQTATLRRVEGDGAAGIGDDGQTIVVGAPVSTAREALVTENGDYRFFAGWRSDPFFFDTMGALNNLQFTGEDFFTDKDVCSIALEIPNSALGSGKMGLWHRSCGRRKRQMGSGGPRCAGLAICIPYRRRDRCLRGWAAVRRCPFHQCICALAGAHGGICPGGSKAGRRDSSAGYPPLRSEPTGVLPGKWPDTHRRRH